MVAISSFFALTYPCRFIEIARLYAKNDLFGLEPADIMPIIAINKTRQAYTLRGTLKPAGYFFLGR